LNIAVLITCYNRKVKSVFCIRSLLQNKLENINYLDVFLVDDGSTDGTSAAIQNEFPKVNIIQGDGTLYWNGGMRLAWSHALENDYDYDFYLWLNDDSMIYFDAVSRLIATYDSLIDRGNKVGAVIGTMIDPVVKTPTYGGRVCNSYFNPLSFGPVLQPENKPLKCDFVNGNFTLIPSDAVKKIGILSDAYTHSMGDFDYGLRLKKAGMTCWVAPDYFGECELNSEKFGCKDTSLSLSERVNKMKSINQMPPVEEWKHFVREHGGYIWPFLYLKVWLRGTFPTLWVILRSRNIG